MKRSVIFFTRKQHAELRDDEFTSDLNGDGILLKTSHDLISTGTELANYNALPNTTGASESNFPLLAGYSASAVVQEVGPEVRCCRPGDRVIMPWQGHRSLAVIREYDLLSCYEDVHGAHNGNRLPARVPLVHIPDEVSMEEASFTHLASFPMLAVRKLKVEMGESVMVAGLGLLGLLAVQFARLSGACPVIACDFVEERRKLALELGADYALNPGDPDFVKQVLDITGGKGVNCAVEVTGAISALQQALEYTAWLGRIALLGCTRISDQTIDYYKYVHCRGISLLGCHTYSRPKLESRAGEWTEADDYRTFLNFLKSGRINVKSMISQIRSPKDATEIYEMLNRPDNPLCGVVLDWNLI